MVAVNLSACQLARSELVEEVAMVLRRTGIEPGTSCREITESAAMQDALSAIVVLETLKGLGVHLAIDDFGTGYSSLSYLQLLPVDLIEIDRSFVSGLGISAGDQAIVRSVVSLGQSLGLTSVAEGVETSVHLAELRAMDCALAQDNYFSKPLRGSSLMELLARNPRW